MSQPRTEQLDKILALADSGHDSEAVSAVRKARALMIRDGISFGDLAHAAAGRAPRRLRLFSGLSRRPGDDATVAHLHARIAELEGQLRAQDLQINFWRRLAGDLQRRVKDASRLASAETRLAPLPARFALPVSDAR